MEKNDLISRQATIKALKTIRYMGDAISIVYHMPAAGVRQVKGGRWIDEPDRHYHWHCSVCGYVEGVHKMNCKYCPNCGTKMDGEGRAET